MGDPAPCAAGACAARLRRGGREPVYPVSGAGRSVTWPCLPRGRRDPSPPPLPIGWPGNPGRALLRACARTAAALQGAGRGKVWLSAPHGALRSRSAGQLLCSPHPPCRPPAARSGLACAQSAFAVAVAPGSPHRGAVLMASTLGGGDVQRIETVVQTSNHSSPTAWSRTSPPAAYIV